IAAVSKEFNRYFQLPETIRVPLKNYQEHFQLVRELIRRLGNYKDLHELLHKVQVECYDEIQRELPRFPTYDGNEALDGIQSRLAELSQEMRRVIARDEE